MESAFATRVAQRGFSDPGLQEAVTPSPPSSGEGWSGRRVPIFLGLRYIKHAGAFTALYHKWYFVSDFSIPFYMQVNFLPCCFFKKLRVSKWLQVLNSLFLNHLRA